MSSIFTEDLKEKSKAIIGLENNCFTCSKTENNREIIKAFKMACLTYTPGRVEFEKLTYSREELIAAKQLLMNYCLSQLRHLNLGDVEQSSIKEKID